MNSFIRLQIITPEGVVHDGSVLSFTAPGFDGRFGILPNHVPYLCILKPGNVVARCEEESMCWEIGDGVADINGSSASLTVQSASRVHISLAR